MNQPDALQVFILGVSAGLLLGVPLGRWSVFVLLHQARQRVRRRPQVARPAPQQQVQHAGQYVTQGRRAGWGQLDPPEAWTRVRS